MGTSVMVMMYADNGWAWSVMMLMPLLWVALLGAIVWAAVRLAQTGGQSSSQSAGPRQETPQEILDRRFASGEIDEQAYDAARDRLAGRAPRSS